MLQLPFQMPTFPGFTLLLMSSSRMAFQRQTYPCVIGTCFLFSSHDQEPYVSCVQTLPPWVRGGVNLKTGWPVSSIGISGRMLWSEVSQTCIETQEDRQPVVEIL